MLKDIVKIFYKSDFTIQWELPVGYEGQDFRFTLFTNDDIEDGWTASYIDGTYTHCLVEDDRVTIYVDAKHNMKAGCLTVQSEYDLGNNHFADGTETIKDRVKTNIYLVSIGANGTSATFIASNRADLTGSGDFVTFSDLDAMSYITSNELSQMSYVTISDLDDYLTQEEIEDMGFLTQAQLSAMGYATTDYIDSKDYATSAQVAMKQNLLVSGRNIKTVNGYSLLGQGNITIESGSEGEYNVIEAIEVNGETQPIDNKTVNIIVPTKVSDLNNDTGFITESALGEMVTYSYLETAIGDFVTSEDLVDDGYVTDTDVQGMISESGYITQTEISQMGYVTSSDLSGFVTDTEVQTMMTNAGYVTSNELSQMGYINTQYLDQASYVTQQGLSAMGYITAAQVPTPDMSAYVTKTELSNAGYVTSNDLSGFVTDTELSNVLSTASYVTQNELSNAGYITNSTLSQASYVTQQGLSGMGYVTNTALSQMSYATTTQLNTKQDALVSGTNIKTVNGSSLLGSGDLTITGGSSISEVTQAQYDAMEQAGTLDPNTIYVITDATPSDLSYYVTKTELSNAGYITINDVPVVDTSSYVTKTELSNAGYATPSDLSYYALKTDLTENIVPKETNTYTLGNATYYYAASYTTDVWFSTKNRLSNRSDNQVNLQLNNGWKYTFHSNGFSPANNNTQSLGQSTSQWSYTYSTNFIENGTNIKDIYTTKTEISNAGYITNTALSQMSYATTTQLNAKQDALVSGTNIKTINNQTLLGSGNITVTSSGMISEVTQAEYDAMEQAGTLDPDTIYVITDAAPGDLSYYMTLSYAESYYLPLSGGEITGQLYVSYNALHTGSYSLNTYSHIVAGTKDKTTVSLIGTKRKCSTESYMSCFFTNSDGRSKFSHKTQGNNTDPGAGVDDAFLCFNSQGFKLAYSGTDGVAATTEYDIIHTGNISSFGYLTSANFIYDSTNNTLTISI